MSDVVKYNNDFNLLPMPDFLESQMNVFMAIISKFKDKQSRHIELKIDDFARMCNFSRDSLRDFLDHFRDFSLKILNHKIFYETKDKYYAFVCFEKLVADRTNIYITIQKDFFEMLTNYQLGFTRFELMEFVNLSGKYTKTLYRLLKQYRSTGRLKMEWDEFMRIMDIPENYKLCDIDKRILKPAIKQLSQEINLFDQARIPFKNLAYEKIKGKGRGRGGNVIGIEFSFKPQQAEIQVKDDGKKVTDIDIQQWEKYAHNALNGAYRYEYKGNFYQFYDTKIKDNNPQLEAYLILTELQENDNNDLEPTQNQIQISFRNIKHLLEKIRENKVIRMLD